ncbi:MAG: PorT family protein [Ferruginibacter sp.]|nr:PorT family protein [Cytophagales bacterium]
MKKLYVLILLAGAYSSTQAQENGPLTYGIKVGGHVTTNYGPGDKYYISKPFVGTHAGLYAQYALAEKLSVQVEALVATRGINARYYSTSSQQFPYPGVGYSSPVFLGASRGTAQRSVHTRIDAFYLDIPVAVHYEVLDNVRVHAGVMYSAYLGRREYVRNTYGQDDNFRVPANNQLRTMAARGPFDRFEKHQFGGLVGATYHFPFGLQAGGRYNLGLTRINRPVAGGRDLRYAMGQIFVAYDLSRFFAK